MTDIFISYGREDQAFVHYLYQALAARNREVWVDWRNIPLTEDWLAQVYAGIEAADTFLFIISPDSVRSDACSLEIGHAVEHNKRLVPILHRPVQSQAVPPPMTVPSWVFLRQGDDFYSGVEAMLAAIDTDLDWVRDHTRLTVRAVEWNSQGREDSFVLRGQDLRHAEQWLAQGPQKEPQPTTLQAQYITAGRNAATKRRRITFGGVVLSLVISVILAILAVSASQRAEQEEQISGSRELASRVQRVMWNGDVITGHQLAIQAHQTAPTLESLQALYTVVLKPCPQVLIAGHTEKVYSAGFAPDGTRIATASRDHTIRLWDAETGAQLAKIENWVAVNTAVLSPDGTRLVTSDWAGLATVWDVETGEILVELEGHTDRVNTASFDPSGTRIVTASDDGTARVWDAATGAELLRLGGGSIFVIATASFSPDGRRIVTASWDGSASVWDAANGAELLTLTGHRDLLTSASFSSDGKWIVTSSWDRTARVWDAGTGQEVVRIEGRTIINYASFGPDGQTVVTAGRDGSARVWDVSMASASDALSEPNTCVATAVELANLQGHTEIVNTASFSPDGKRIVTASDDSTVLVWELQQLVPLSLRGHVNWLTAASFSPDGERIVTASYDATIRVWSAETGAELSRIRTFTGIINSASFSPEGGRIVTSIRDSAVVWDAATGAELARLEGHANTVNSARFSPDGTQIVTASDDGTAQVWDAETGRQLLILQGHGTVGGVMSASFSPDGQRIVTAGGDRTARVWDVRDGAELLRLEGHLGEVQAAAFSPDGTQIVTASWDGTAIVWDAATGEEQVFLDGHADRVNSAEFSPDGRQVVTASWDGTAWVWDVESGKGLAQLEGHTDLVTTASFSPSGTQIVTASWDGTARVWPWAPTAEQVLQRVEARLDRLGIEIFGLEDMMGRWSVIWDKGTADEETGVMNLTATSLPKFAIEVAPDGTVTFTDDEGCEHVGRLSRTKDFAAGTYTGCDAYPDWVGEWEVVKISD